jgi:prephenate dehydratase
MKLNEISSKINKIDRELLVLLQERMGLALRSNKFQESSDDTHSEENVLERVNRMNLDLIKSSFSRQLLKTIIDESKRLQDEDRHLVAFQGEHGAYGEVASRKLMPTGAYIPCLEFIDVFRGVEDGHFDLGVVPVENSVVVNHCLLATEVTDYREIRVVYSHPQALAQCREFLMRNKLEPRPYYDTAGAAKMLARENPKASAAIASALCSELYDLEIIKEGIEDGPANSTRFLLLSREASAAKNDKTSIIFAVAHEAGQLYGVLQLFAEAKINLTRISSMPLRSDPSNYSFFLDFEGSEKDAHVAEVLQKMSQMTISLKNLGSYPAYKGEA